MGTPVDANGRSILHKGHGMTHVSAVPDVCKTPTPGGPVPIPYPNLAMDSNLVDGAASVQIEGNPVTNVKSKISTSTGDEPGTVGGIMSNVNKGTCTWKMGSPDVKAEGESVVRFLDTSFHNGNGFNTAFPARGATGMGYAMDFDGPCKACGESPMRHAVPSIAKDPNNSAKLCADIIKQHQETSKKTSGGFMVGAMICGLHQKGYGAKSAKGMVSFDSSVSAAGATPILPNGPATIDQMMSANTSAAAPAAAAHIFSKWTEINSNLLSGRYGPGSGYTTPGTCAGAKLLANSGHKPTSMTEMYFQPKGAAPTTLGPYHCRSNGLKTDKREYSSAGEIGSCNTCQDLLYLTMCPERKCR